MQKFTGPLGYKLINTLCQRHACHACHFLSGSRPPLHYGAVREDGDGYNVEARHSRGDRIHDVVSIQSGHRIAVKIT